MKRGWLVNDCLTCIPGTKTFWHDILEWFPFIADKCNGYTNFNRLPKRIEDEVTSNGSPDFILRNATFFRKLNIPCKTISFLQDCYTGQRRHDQLKVCNSSDVVVFNSNYTKSFYRDNVSSRIEVIPIGTDFDFFNILDDKDRLFSKWRILDNSILFIGSTNQVKGFQKIQWLIDNTNYNFCLIMKDDFKSDNKRVKVFNKMKQSDVKEIINCCSMLVCSSTTETLHLAGVEAAACNVPLLVTDVGVYHGLSDGNWGRKVKNDDYISGVEDIMSKLDDFSPREEFIKLGLDKRSCQLSWRELLDSI